MIFGAIYNCITLIAIRLTLGYKIPVYGGDTASPADHHAIAILRTIFPFPVFLRLRRGKTKENKKYKDKIQTSKNLTRNGPCK